MGKTWSYAKGGPTDPPKKIPVSGYRRPDGLWEMPNGETYANPEPFVLKEERYTAGNYPAVNGKVPIGRKYIVYNDPTKQDGWQEFADGGPVDPKKTPEYKDHWIFGRYRNPALDTVTENNIEYLPVAGIVTGANDLLDSYAALTDAPSIKNTVKAGLETLGYLGPKLIVKAAAPGMKYMTRTSKYPLGVVGDVLSDDRVMNRSAKRTPEQEKAISRGLQNAGPKYGTGGPIKPPKNEPIYVTDPKDPRLTAYNDSLSLYNYNNDRLQKLLKLNKDVGAENKIEYSKSLPKDVYNSAKTITQGVPKGMYKKQGVIFESLEHYQIDPINSWKLIQLYDKYKAPSFIKKMGLFNDKSQALVDYGLVYKKPTQPVALKEEKEKINKPISTTNFDYKKPTQPVLLEKNTSIQTKQPSIEPLQLQDEQLQPRQVDLSITYPKAINTYSAAGYPMVGGKNVPSGRIHDGKTWSIIE